MNKKLGKIQREALARIANNLPVISRNPGRLFGGLKKLGLIENRGNEWVATALGKDVIGLGAKTELVDAKVDRLTEIKPKAEPAPKPWLIKDSTEIGKTTKPKEKTVSKRHYIVDRLLGNDTPALIGPDAARIYGGTPEKAEDYSAGYVSDVRFYFRLFGQYGLIKPGATLPASVG